MRGKECRQEICRSSGGDGSGVGEIIRVPHRYTSELLECIDRLYVKEWTLTSSD